MKVKSIYLMGNGNVAVFDEKGQQIPKLQINVIVQIMEKAKRMKIELDEKMEILINGERWYKVKGYSNITQENLK